MKRVDQQIDLIRERTRNLNFSIDSDGNPTEGITNNLLLHYMNESQDHLQAAILSVYPNEFVDSQTFNITGSTEDYTISPKRLFINNKIISVKYSSSGREEDYVVLDQRQNRDRKSYTGYPEFYIRQGNTIKLNPIPQSTQGTVRVDFYKELDDLDIRRGQVTARTLTATQLTALTLDTANDDPTALSDADYICVNDRYGVVKMYNIPITSYSSTTGVVTLSAFTFASGETVAVGDYVTVGKYTTTQSKLMDNCERYILMYAQKRMLTTDESNTSLEEDVELKTIEQDIINSFADESRDIKYIPIIDYDIFI